MMRGNAPLCERNGNTNGPLQATCRASFLTPKDRIFRHVPTSAAAPSSSASFTVMGWGYTSYSTSTVGDVSETLQEVNVINRDLAQCNMSYGGRITENVICAGEWIRDSNDGAGLRPLSQSDRAPRNPL